MSASFANEEGADAGSAPKGRPNPKDILDQPLRSPPPPDYKEAHPLDTRPEQHVSLSVLIGRSLLDTIRVPARWIRENVVEPNRGPKYYYYHRRFKRALPIDECYLDDQACIMEANLEYRRTHLVDRYTLELLRQRRDNCNLWYVTQKGKWFPSDECKEIADTYKREEVNFHIKYGDLHFNAGSIHAYNKQKHRMIVERRIALQKQHEAAESAANSARAD